jgi:hypothetical protein
MNAIIAIQDLIKQNQMRIKILKKQLVDHEDGTSRLTSMAKASSEMGLEKSYQALEKNQIILKELQQRDLLELEKERQLKEAIQRRNYYKYQKVRLKRDLSMTNDQKLEAMMIVDELPHDLEIEDKELFDIAEATINLDIRTHDVLYEELKEIKKDWQELLKSTKAEDVSTLGMVNIHVPILVLHLSVLIKSIQDHIEENNLPEFKGLPAFEDWWITELWTNHQAYFGLYKWRDIIVTLCMTKDQRRAWNVIFSNWVLIKKVLNSKGTLGFEYNFAFDSLVDHYTKLKEELNKDNLFTMEKIVKEITQKEDFSKYRASHQIETEYLEFKRNKINYQVQ